MKPLLIYDGDCKFCGLWVSRWLGWTQGRVDASPYQKAAPRFPRIPIAEFEKSVRFVEADGKIYSGAEAVFRALAYAPGKGWLFMLYRRFPGFAGRAESTYRFVAARRSAFSKLTRWLWGCER